MKKLVMSFLLGVTAIGVGTSVDAIGSKTLSAPCNGAAWSYYSGGNVHAETYRNGSTTCVSYGVRARNGIYYSTWGWGATEAHRSIPDAPISSPDGGVHQNCVPAGCGSTTT